ncbi:transcriptional regulator NikR, CopG family [Ferrimonas balearica DSM 9799]|uniref:Transcriptional regulator NikR, CopG family n=1 Tax=Ferrimonas balearica (strain DSM 9799 / CCM 4581 / KCTC 23876 / PAT) TaxID=550540 RepID=E1SP92_FERBD|nr:nickel-responsive transcriptional regulator NikR [Ferrimonas balearica]ADN75717.1 transcriptional regulator NikR, CopG family [Ferrimonas balearica DSM 9799]MBY5979386.1 nickel-responsive transcriptional regulator NikR [Ferrimonas balearica]MBY6016180.1 nickel-responsive transcriptional regulator NikR [Halomonas denitrificans]MBY6095551.1 nickel-responsive transcriptional regulator NikR [Ferrimonas balearica]
MTTERITVSLDSELLSELDRMTELGEYRNRSEFFRDLIRQRRSEQLIQAEPDTDCMATLSYVFDTRKRTLLTRLQDNLNQHHDIVRASQIVCLDDHFRLESVALVGKAHQLNQFANLQLSESGVMNGCLHLVPMILDTTI